MLLTLVPAMTACVRSGSVDGAAADNDGGVPPPSIHVHGIEFCRIPAGTYHVGATNDSLRENVPDVYLALEGDRLVEIERDIYLQATEVTVRQYLDFVEQTSRSDWLVPECDTATDDIASTKDQNRPIVCVSWNDAVAYCKWLSIQSGYECRLPTEYEWEIACRYGNDGMPYIIKEDKQMSYRAWVTENSSGQLQEVGLLEANDLGIHDMLGNAWEWTSTKMTRELAEQSGLGDTVFVIRGGSVDNKSRVCRCSARWAGWPPEKRSSLVGFRVALSREN